MLRQLGGESIRRRALAAGQACVLGQSITSDGVSNLGLQLLDLTVSGQIATEQ